MRFKLVLFMSFIVGIAECQYRPLVYQENLFSNNFARPADPYVHDFRFPQTSVPTRVNTEDPSLLYNNHRTKQPPARPLSLHGNSQPHITDPRFPHPPNNYVSRPSTPISTAANNPSFNSASNYLQNEQSEEELKNFQDVIHFAWNLFQRTNQPQQPNVIMCPLSAQHILSYLAYASQGDSKKEIVNAISFDSPKQLNWLTNQMLSSPNQRDLQFATAIFLAKTLSIKPSYRQILQNTVEIIPVDFYDNESFSQQYGRWIAEKTRGVLTKVRAEFHPSTKMIMSSAVYFKGEWFYKMNPIGFDTFYVAPNHPVQTEMLQLVRKLYYGKIDNFIEWVVLPYKSEDNMIVFLPDKNIAVDEAINLINIHDVVGKIRKDNQANVTLTLPKFKVESKFSLLQPLNKMGIQTIFGPEAQLPNLISSNEPIAITNILQHASLEVNEHGTIATSITSVSAVSLSIQIPAPDIEFKVNRPFIAMIFDRKFDFPYFIAKIAYP